MSLTKVNYIDNSTIITAKNLNDIQDNIIQNAELIKKVAPRNLLDNSDFTNPVNQRGFVSGTSGEANYTIDRWWLQHVTNLHLYSDCIGLSGFWDVTQWIGSKITTGTTLTFAVMAKSEAATGNVFLSINNTTNSHGREIRDSINNIEWKTIVGHWTADRDYDIGEVKFILGINTGNELTTQIYYKCPVVYEGEYTIDTLPEYQPKGYGVELAECQRYYRKITDEDNTVICQAIAYNSTSLWGTLPFSMRISNPTIKFDNIIWTPNSISGASTVSSIGVEKSSCGITCVMFRVDGAVECTTYNIWTSGTGGYLEINADL